jgi:hypothetical protein
MQKFVRILVALALVGLALWWIFPSQQRVIRRRLKEVAATASFEPNEGPLAKAYNATKLGGYFTEDVAIVVDSPGWGTHTLNGRDQLVQADLALRQRMSGAKIEFVDINITFGPDGQTAVANLTAKATFSGERDFQPQEFNFMLKRVNRTWLIYRVETVKTLSQASAINHRLSAVSSEIKRSFQ